MKCVRTLSDNRDELTPHVVLYCINVAPALRNPAGALWLFKKIRSGNSCCVFLLHCIDVRLLIIECGFLRRLADFVKSATEYDPVTRAPRQQVYDTFLVNAFLVELARSELEITETARHVSR
jgi:hypothetical protein